MKAVAEHRPQVLADFQLLSCVGGGQRKLHDKEMRTYIYIQNSTSEIVLKCVSFFRQQVLFLVCLC